MYLDKLTGIIVLIIPVYLVQDILSKIFVQLGPINLLPIVCLQAEFCRVSAIKLKHKEIEVIFKSIPLMSFIMEFRLPECDSYVCPCKRL